MSAMTYQEALNIWGRRKAAEALGIPVEKMTGDVSLTLEHQDEWRHSSWTWEEARTEAVLIVPVNAWGHPSYGSSWTHTWTVDSGGFDFATILGEILAVANEGTEARISALESLVATLYDV